MKRRRFISDAGLLDSAGALLNIPVLRTMVDGQTVFAA